MASSLSRSTPDDYHHETSMGSLAILPGARKGIFALMDATTAFQEAQDIFQQKLVSHQTGF